MTQLIQIKAAFILIVAGVFFTSNVFGQANADAKLYAIWSDTTKPETDRIDAYFKKFDVWRISPDLTDTGKKWYVDSDKAIELAKKHGRAAYLPLFYMVSGYKCTIVKKNIDCSSCTELNKVIESSKIANASIYPVFWAYLSLSDTCKTKAKDEDAINEFKKIKNTLTEAPGDITILRELNLSLGSHFKYQNKYPIALRHYLESLRLSENKNLMDSLYLWGTLEIGTIHTTIANYKEADKYLAISLKLAHKLKDPQYIGVAYMLTSELKLKQKNEVEAQLYIDSAMHIMKNIKRCEDCYYAAKATNASIKNLSGNYTGALAELAEIQNHFKGDANDYLAGEKAKAWLGLKKYDSAINILTSIKVTGQKYTKEASDNYDILSKAYEATGDYNKALKNYRLYIQVEDTLAAWRNSSEVTRLELENQFTQQQLKSELVFQTQLNKQKSTRNWILFLGISSLLLALGLYARLRFIRKTQKLLQHKNEIIHAAKEKAEASEKAKHQFLANMSHEIRTPMNAIKGMTDILIRRNPKEDQREYLDGIKQSSDSLLIIINDILDISKIEAGKVELEQEPFSVTEVMNNVYTIMQFKAEEKGLELKKEMPPEELNVKGDATRLGQILINLIGNAIKFTEKGLITTTIHSEKSEGKLNLHFSVSDTGIGIDEDRKSKIFESFEQAYSDTSRKFGGTGLGLSISKKLVELHKGSIWVESEKGKGSQFHCVIPYAIAEITSEVIPAEDLHSNIAVALKGIRILLVEDNAFNIVVAQEELEDAIEGVYVEVAENGLIAVEKLKSSFFDVVLMDVQMPVMNGFEATKAIRKLDSEKAHTPIIAMTANVLKEEVDLCYQAGVNNFIGKPFDTKELLNKIFSLKK